MFVCNLYSMVKCKILSIIQSHYLTEWFYLFFGSWRSNNQLNFIRYISSKVKSWIISNFTYPTRKKKKKRQSIHFDFVFLIKKYTFCWELRTGNGKRKNMRRWIQSLFFTCVQISAMYIFFPINSMDLFPAVDYFRVFLRHLF